MDDADWDFLPELKLKTETEKYKIQKVNIQKVNIQKVNIQDMSVEFKEIPGLSILQDSITEKDEEKIIKRILQGTWVNAPGSREVQQYGKLYDYKTRALGEQTAMPNWLIKLADFLDLPKPENVIINKYEPGEGIASHTDNPCFGEAVASLSLASPITMDLKFNALHHQIRLEPRSLLKLTGEARHRWTHGIANRKNDVVNGDSVPRQTRYSITFRTIL